MIPTGDIFWVKAESHGEYLLGSHSEYPDLIDDKFVVVCVSNIWEALEHCLVDNNYFFENHCRKNPGNNNHQIYINGEKKPLIKGRIERFRCPKKARFICSLRLLWLQFRAFQTLPLRTIQKVLSWLPC